MDLDENGMVLARLSFRVQPHKRPEILSVVDDTVARMREAEGCGQVHLYSDCDDPLVFTVVSEWRTAEEARAFVGSKDFRPFRAILMLMRGEPVLEYDDVLVRVRRAVN